MYINSGRCLPPDRSSRVVVEGVTTNPVFRPLALSEPQAEGAPKAGIKQRVGHPEATSMRHRIAGLVVLVVLVVCSAASAATGQAANRWPANQERSFLVNCNVTSGGQAAMCRCELRWLERRYTYPQIAAIYLHNRTRMVAIILRASADCLQYRH